MAVEKESTLAARKRPGFPLVAWASMSLSVRADVGREV